MLLPGARPQAWLRGPPRLVQGEGLPGQAGQTVLLRPAIHSHWLGSGEQVNDDPDARTVAAEDEGPQPVVAGQGGDHAVAVGAEVYGGDIRTKSAGNLLKCGAQVAVEHDSQSFLFYPRAVCHGARPIEHDAPEIVMRPGTRHHRLCRSLPGIAGRFRRLGGLSGVRLLAVARAVAATNPSSGRTAKHRNTTYTEYAK